MCVRVCTWVCMCVSMWRLCVLTHDLGFWYGVDLHLDLNGIEDLKVIGQICRLCNCQYKKLPRVKVMGVRARSIDHDHGHRSGSQGENKRKKKTPAYRTSSESMGYKTSQTTLTLTLRLWPLTFVTLILVTLTLSYDPWPSWPRPWTTFSDTRLKTGFFYLGDFDIWPMTLTFILVRDMIVLNVCAKF